MAYISTMSVGNGREVHDLTFYRFAIKSLPLAVMTVDGLRKVGKAVEPLK